MPPPAAFDAANRSMEALRAKLRRGHDLTLVLGAGVSVGRGVPSWPRLAATVCGQFGVSLPSDVVNRHPLALPIAFELAELSARRPRHGASFVEVLRDALYADLRPAKAGDTIAVLSRFLRREQSAPTRRLRRVITFNADDLLEIGANGKHHPLRTPVAWPIARESSGLRMERGAGGRSPISIYHVHGFLPRRGSPLARRDGADALVFTEAQYWSSFAEPTSFPNRVILGALHDSVCVFIGLSMTDINIARWLGLRANAMARDREQRLRSGDGVVAMRSALDDHFWIRTHPEPSSTEAYVTPILRRRGVRAIDLNDWSELGSLMSSLLD